jgi:formamidopyrimidine-DNA glycosylase
MPSTTTGSRRRRTRRPASDVLHAGIDAKGATIDDFRDANGAEGSFQDRFQVHLREGQPCPRCGTGIKKIRAAGRGTYFCPSCQRMPRTLK